LGHLVGKSYHALKFLLLILLYRNVSASAVIEQLQKWFEDNPASPSDLNRKFLP